MEDYTLFCDKRFDQSFDGIELLKRYPWVGCNFVGSKCRPLIIGDSHYAVEKGNFSQAAYDEFMDKQSTRNMVNTVIDNKVKGERTWNMQEGLLKTFIEVTPDNVKTFWSRVAFYNFIQRIMEKSNEKPTDSDKEKGWKCLVEVSKVLKPTSILIIGTRNWYGLDVVDSIAGVKKEGWYWDRENKISRTNPGRAKLIFEFGEIPITIIHHTAQGYCVESWKKYLLNIEHEMMGYLQTL